MPIYEYVCKKCGGHMEITQKITDSPLTSFPENLCSKLEQGKCPGKAEKIISKNTFHLKGKGWFASGGY